LIHFHTILDLRFDFRRYILVYSNVFDVVLSSQVDRAPVAQRKALEEKDEDPAAKDRILRPGQSTKELVARAQYDKILLFEVFLTSILKLAKLPIDTA
jgi:hypothetical protein